MEKAMNEAEFGIKKADDPPAKEKPAPEVRVLTVHLEPVLPPRVSNQAIRLSMDYSITQTVRNRAAARVELPIFEKDVEELVAKTREDFFLVPPVKELVVNLDPSKIPQPEQKALATTQQSNSFACDMFRPGYYSAGLPRRRRPGRSTKTADESQAADPMEWLRHEFPDKDHPSTPEATFPRHFSGSSTKAHCQSRGGQTSAPSFRAVGLRPRRGKKQGSDVP